MKPPAKSTDRKSSYHHGNLREALLESAEEILREEGPQGLKLRAITRRAGVSHTAANPHFGGLNGLISELAAVGFRRLRASLVKARTPGRGYVDFALNEPHLFSLMFRSNLPDFDYPALREAADAAARELRRVGDADPEGQPLAFDEGVRMTAAWSLVHGLSSLIIDGQLDTIARRLTPPTDPAALIDAVLAQWARTPETP